MPNGVADVDVELCVDAIGDREWRVRLNGELVIAFAGPNAHVRAQLCATELAWRCEVASRAPSSAADPIEVPQPRPLA